MKYMEYIEMQNFSICSFDAFNENQRNGNLPPKTYLTNISNNRIQNKKQNNFNLKLRNEFHAFTYQ